MFANHPVYREDMERIRSLSLPWERLEGKTLLVTGASGLIGSAVADFVMALNGRGANIRLLAMGRSGERIALRFPSYADHPLFIPLIQDAAEPLRFEGRVDYIIHAASNAHPLAFASQPVETIWGNIMGARILLERLRAQAGGRLILLSTGEVYGSDPSVTEGYAETDAGRVQSMQPRACYPEGKRASETLCAAYASEYGVDSVVARLCYVYGAPISAANTRADSQFLRKAASGEDIVLKSAATQVRSYCYLADCVAALMHLLLLGQTGEAYNVCTWETASIRAYAETLADLAGVGLRFDLPSDAEKKGFSTVSRAVQRPDKLMALGFVPACSLREGLSRTLDIYRDAILRR